MTCYSIVIANSGSNLMGNLPIRDGKNWERWCTQMEVVFDYQDVLEIVQNGYPDLGEDPTDAARAVHKESRKRDCKALFLIHQGVDNAHFENIASAKTSKAAWDILVKCYDGGDKLKQVNLQTLKRQFELVQMENSERIGDYFTRILSLTNQMKGCGEQVLDRTIVEKVMRTLLPKFDYIAVAIEESKDLRTMSIEELQGSLQAHEQRILERSNDKNVSQALVAQALKIKNNDKGKSWKNKEKGKYAKSGAGSSSYKKDSNSDQDHGDSFSKKGSGGSNSKERRKKFDRKKIKCFNCQKFGHFANECKSDKRRGDGDEAHMAQEDSNSDLDPVLLMTTSDADPPEISDSWYLDTGCSN